MLCIICLQVHRWSIIIPPMIRMITPVSRDHIRAARFLVVTSRIIAWQLRQRWLVAHWLFFKSLLVLLV